MTLQADNQTRVQTDTPDGTSVPACDSASEERRNEDRRSLDRRRNARGLFEFRARKDRVVDDRRQSDRRTRVRSRLAFWRRSSI